MRPLLFLLTLVGSTVLAQAPATTPAHPCKADRERLCHGAGRGPAMRECMKAHVAELSETCKAALIERRQGGKHTPAPAP